MSEEGSKNHCEFFKVSTANLNDIDILTHSDKWWSTYWSDDWKFNNKSQNLINISRYFIFIHFFLHSISYHSGTLILNKS